MADYSMLGSFSTGGASALSGDLLTKLREAEEKVSVAPLDKKLETAETEAEKILEIETQVTAFADMMNYFKIGEKDNVFTQKIMDTTGSSVVFEANDSADLPDGMTSIHVDQLAQKDVYQSATTTSKTTTVGGVNEGDAITIGIASKPIYQSASTYTNSATDTIGSGDGKSFTIDYGTSTMTVNTESTTTWDQLKDLINGDDENGGKVIASFENNRLTITHSDKKTTLSFTDGDSVLSNLGVKDTESGKKFSAVRVDRYYTGVADDAGDKTGLVGEGTFTIKTDGKTAVSFKTDDTTTWEGLQEKINAHPSFSASFVDGDSNGSYELKISASDSSLAVSITENLTGVDDAGFTETKSTVSRTYEELAAAINADDDLEASMEQVGDDSYRLILKSSQSGTANLLTISAQGTMDDADDTLDALGILDPTDGADDGTVPDNHVLVAQNLKAEVDGIDYELSENTIKLASGLNIKALKIDETGDVSTLTVSKDTSAVLVAAEQMVEQYNKLVDLVTTELNNSDSSITDKDSLRRILADTKNILFDKYGATTPEWGSQTDSYGDIVLAHSNVLNNDMNLFNYGFTFNTEGHLLIDNDIFNDGLEDKMDDFKALFVGSYENKGLGTMLNEYLADLSGYEGLLYNYDMTMITNKADTEKEKEDAVKLLDAKYQTMAETFASYGAVISKMESSFSGLKQMMAMETSGS
jgi:flagellar capping protein FliD